MNLWAGLGRPAQGGGGGGDEGSGGPMPPGPVAASRLPLLAPKAGEKGEGWGGGLKFKLE